MLCPKCNNEVNEDDAFCHTCGKALKRKKVDAIGLKISTISLSFIVILFALYRFLPDLRNVIEVNTPTPIPTIILTPTPRPTSLPSYKEYGLAKGHTYGNFIKNYNKNVEWLLAQSSTAISDYTLRNNYFYEEKWDEDKTDRQNVTFNMTISIFTTGPYVKEIVFMYDNYREFDDLNEAYCVINSLIYTADAYSYGNIIEDFDVSKALSGKREYDNAFNNIDYSFKNTGSTVRFSIDF